jgi:hypothetical protein
LKQIEKLLSLERCIDITSSFSNAHSNNNNENNHAHDHLNDCDLCLFTFSELQLLETYFVAVRDYFPAIAIRKDWKLKYYNNHSIQHNINHNTQQNNSNATPIASRYMNILMQIILLMHGNAAH